MRESRASPRAGTVGTSGGSERARSLARAGPVLDACNLVTSTDLSLSQSPSPSVLPCFPVLSPLARAVSSSFISVRTSALFVLLRQLRASAMEPSCRCDLDFAGDADSAKVHREEHREETRCAVLDCDKCSVINFIRVSQASWIAQALRRSRARDSSTVVKSDQ